MLLISKSTWHRNVLSKNEKTTFVLNALDWCYRIALPNLYNPAIPSCKFHCQLNKPVLAVYSRDDFVCIWLYSAMIISVSAINRKLIEYGCVWNWHKTTCHFRWPCAIFADTGVFKIRITILKSMQFVAFLWDFSQITSNRQSNTKNNI